MTSGRRVRRQTVLALIDPARMANYSVFGTKRFVRTLLSVRRVARPHCFTGGVRR